MTEAGYRNIRIEHSGTISWIVLDRPDKANALSTELLDEFSAALDRLATEGGPVIGIRGEGRGFSAGYDIGALGDYGHADPVVDLARLQRNILRYLAIWDHPKPVIAAVHGYCMAGATQMCVYADITIVTDDARIGEPTIPIGGGYVAPLWVPLVGAKRAKEFSFVPGNTIDGRTAVEWGWANHAVPAGELVAIVEDLAGRIARTPPDVLRVKKQSINKAAEAAGYRQASEAGASLNALLHMAPSVLELRRWVGEVGLRQAIEAFRVPSTTPLTLSRSTKSQE